MSGETGVDTLRLLFEVERLPEERLGDVDGWRVDVNAGLGLVAFEGHPTPGALAAPAEVLRAGEWVRERADELFGVRRDRGVSRLDVTTTRPFERSVDARAFLAGMAAIELPRCESIRRGSPVHSIGWAHASGRRLLARCYDKGLERGGSAFESIRFEDQGRFSSSVGRPVIEQAADPEFQRRRLVQRFAPMARATRGVKAMTVPVLARAIAEEVEYGYRTAAQAKELLGSLVLLRSGAREAVPRATRYRWEARLREAGFVGVDEWQESAEVDLGAELDAALEELGGA